MTFRGVFPTKLEPLPARAFLFEPWGNGTQRLLQLTVDTFFGLAGKPNYDWPNPRGANPGSILNRTHINEDRSLLWGRDTFYGLAGKPTFEWPNPRGAPGTITNFSAVNPNRLIMVNTESFPAGRNQESWPNPMRVASANQLVFVNGMLIYSGGGGVTIPLMRMLTGVGF